MSKESEDMNNVTCPKCKISFRSKHQILEYYRAGEIVCPYCGHIFKEE